MILEVLDVARADVLRNGDGLGTTEFQSGQLHLVGGLTGARSWRRWLVLDDVVNGVEVLHLKYQAVVAVVLRAVDQYLVAALALNEFSLGPEFGVKLDDDVSYLLITQQNILALELKPLLRPLLVPVTQFPTQLEARLDLGNIFVLDLLEVGTVLDVVSDVGWNVACGNVRFIGWVFDVDYVILLPLLKIIFIVLGVLITLRVVRY